jgi:hypothetical protein
MNALRKKKLTALQYELQIQSIELLKTSISLPTELSLTLQHVNFKIGIETKAEPENKHLFVIVSVDMRSKGLHKTLGSIVVSCMYSMVDYDLFVEVKPDGRIEMPLSLTETLNAQSIATTRGIMFATFKGTFLHHALLPMIDPRSLQQYSNYE